MILMEKTEKGEEVKVAPSADEIIKMREEQKHKTQPIKEIPQEEQDSKKEEPQEEKPDEKKDTQPKIEITDEEVEQYAYCACEGIRYKKTYYIMDGKIQVTLRSLSVAEVKALNEFATEKAKDTSWAVFQLVQQTCFLGMHLDSYGPVSQIKPATIPPESLEERYEFASNLQDFLYLSIHEKVIDFGLRETEIKKK